MILDVCIKCGCTTEVDAFSLVCDGCLDYIGETVGGKEMNFIEAIGKYEAITRDGGTTVYSKNSEGNIIRKTNGIGGGFQINYGLLVSTGWVEHKEHKLILPERAGHYHSYMYIEDDTNKVYVDSDCRFDEDTNRLKIFNYFTDKELAQYIADRQLIQRVELVLHHMNMFNPDILNKELLIDEYVRNNYKEVLHRIKDYEMKNVEKIANRTTK